MDVTWNKYISALKIYSWLMVMMKLKCNWRVFGRPGWGAYMVMTRYPLPQNNGNLLLPFSGGDYPIVLMDHIYS